MSSQTPRRLSLRRKRQLNNVKAPGSSYPDHPISSYKGEVDYNSQVTDKVCEDKPVSKEIILKVDSPKTLKVTTTKSGKKPIPPSTPTNKQYNGFSSATPVSSRRNSFNSQRLLALQSSTECRIQQFSSPDSPFMCSQLPCTQDCEVIWDCNSPGFSKDELKRLNANLVSSKTPSPKVAEIVHPNRTLFNLNRPNPRSRRGNRSNKSNGIVAELDNLLTKVQADELTHMNDSLSDDECMPEALPPSGVLKNVTQPFDASILNDEVIVSQINGINKVGLIEPNIQTTNSDNMFDKPNEHLPALKPGKLNYRNENVSEDTINFEAEMSDDDFDNAILEDSSLNNIINNNHHKLYNKSSVNNSCTDESSFLDITDAHNAIRSDTLSSTTDFEDDDLFSDSLLLCTQEMENALYNKKTGNFNSPSTIISRKGTINSFPSSKYLINSDYLKCPAATVCKSDEKSIQSNGNLSTKVKEQECTSTVDSLNKVTRTSFQLGLPFVSDNKNAFYDSNKSSIEQGCDVNEASNSGLQSNKRNSNANPNALCYKKAAMNIVPVVSITRSMSTNSNNSAKGNIDSPIKKSCIDMSISNKSTGVTVTLKKYFSADSPIMELKFSAKNESSVGMSNGVKQFTTNDIKSFHENCKVSAGSSSILTKPSTGSFKLGSESVAPTSSNINENTVQNSSMVDVSQDAASVFEKGFSEEDNDDEFFASLIQLVEKEEKSFANLSHCKQGSSKSNAEMEISFIGSNDKNNYHNRNDYGRCDISKKETNIQSAAPFNSGKETSFWPKNELDKPSIIGDNVLEKNINRTMNENCNIDFMPVKKLLDMSSQNDMDYDVSKTYIRPAADKASRSSFQLEPLASSRYLFKTTSTNSKCSGSIPSEKLSNIVAWNYDRTSNVKGNQLNIFQLPLPSKIMDSSSNKTTSTEFTIQPHSSQNYSDSFDDEDDFFDEDLLDEISIMESQVESSSQTVKPSSLAAKSINVTSANVGIGNKIKSDTNYESKCPQDKFSYQCSNKSIKECAGDPRVTSEEQSRFDEFFSLRSPVSMKSQRMIPKDKLGNRPNFKGFAAVNPSLVENVGNLTMKSNTAVNRTQTDSSRIGGEPALKTVDTLKNQVNKFEFTKSSNQSSKRLSHLCTKDEIARKREEALKKRHKLTRSSFVS